MFVSASGPQSSSSRNALFNPVMAFMGHRDENEDEAEDRESPHEGASGESINDLPELSESTQGPSVVEEKKDDGADTEVRHASEPVFPAEEEEEGELKKQKDHVASEAVDEVVTMTEDSDEVKSDALEPTASVESTIQDAGLMESNKQLDEEGIAEAGSSEHTESAESKIQADQVDQLHIDNVITRETNDAVEAQERGQDLAVHRSTPKQEEGSNDNQAGDPIEHSETDSFITGVESESPSESVNNSLSAELPSNPIQEIVSGQAIVEGDSNIATIEESKPLKEDEDGKVDTPIPVTNVSDSADAVLEREKVKREMKMMEAALQGAARQAQVCLVSVLVRRNWTLLLFLVI